MKVSIITVVYNAFDTIGDTIRSVAAQLNCEFEHIIVDGVSTDGTMAVIDRLRHDRLRVVSEPDRGLYDAMNKGVAMATGELIGFLNADDFFCRTDAVERLAAAAWDVEAVAASIAIVDPATVERVIRGYGAASFRPWMLRFGHMPPHPGFYVRRTVFDRVGGFDRNLRIGADFEWMLRVFGQPGLRWRALPVTVVGLRAGGVSTRGLASMRIINREAAQSTRRHGLRSHPLLMWSRYAVKSLQLLRRPADYPAGDHCWMPDRLGRPTHPA